MLLLGEGIHGLVHFTAPRLIRRCFGLTLDWEKPGYVQRSEIHNKASALDVVVGAGSWNASFQMRQTSHNSFARSPRGRFKRPGT